VSRLWSRVSVRVASVALLLVGVVGGLYLGQDRDVQERTAQVDQVAVVNQAELDLLKERHNEHAAARAAQREAKADAAAKAADEAKAAATKARKLEAASIEKAKKEKLEKERKAKEAKEKEAEEKEDAEPKPFDGPIPASCDEFSGNRKIGCAMTLAAGHDLEQFACLNKLWNRESGWNHKALNRGSGAYGIAQALPGDKMKSAGADWKSNPETQIEWGLGYIKGRYKTPCKAWGHSESVGWY
jgi:hypothetical protein